jgi:DNA-binding response OmpR family regulator
MAASSGEEAVEIVHQQGLPHLAIVDMILPGMDGFAVANEMRRIGNIPIVFLSALADADTKVKALTGYAEDYITKPFSFAEFLARIRRILLRSGSDNALQTEAAIDSRLWINFYQHYAVLDGQRIHLTPIESRLMQVLYTHRGRVLSPSALLARAWDPMQQGTLHSLWVHIRRLRAKLEPDTKRPHYIVTARGRGYYLPAGMRSP